MSFADYDLEAQKLSPKRSALRSNPLNSSGSNLNSIIENTLHQIQTYGLLVASFNNERRLLGGRRDGVQLREKLAASQQNTASLGAAIQRLMADINNVMSSSEEDENELSVSSRQILIKDRLINEFEELENNFELSAREFANQIANLPLPNNKGILLSTGLDESSPLLALGTSGKQQIQIQEDPEAIEQTELQYHMMLTEERNRQIEQVAEGIREVNSIFKDLGELVNQQGEQLDTVEENVLQLSGNVQGASRELNKAHEYQKKKSKWSCILLVAVSVFVLIVILVVLS